jgi:hypothetical protein
MACYGESGNPWGLSVFVIANVSDNKNKLE